MKHYVIEALDVPSSLTIRQEGGRGKDYLRSYCLEGEGRQPLYTAHAYERGFSGSVWIAGSGSEPARFVLKPNRAVMNDGFKLIDHDERQVVANITRDVSWQVSDMRGKVLASVKDATAKSDRFGCSLGGQARIKGAYFLVARGRSFASATPGHLLEQRPALQSSGLRRLFSGLGGAEQKTPAVALAYRDFVDISPVALMSLMMVQHEFCFQNA